MKDSEARVENLIRKFDLGLRDFQKNTLTALLLLFGAIDGDFGIIEADEFLSLLEDFAQLGIVHEKTEGKGEVEAELRISKSQILSL